MDKIILTVLWILTYLYICGWTSSGFAGASQEVSSSRCSPHLHLDSNLPSSTMQAFLVVFEAELEARHCSRIFHCTGNHVPIVNNSVGEKVPSYLQPGCLLPQIKWAVCTSGRSPSICCQLEPCPVIHSVYPLHVWTISAWSLLSSREGRFSSSNFSS